MTTEDQDVVTTVADGIGAIRINRPQLMNAGTLQTWNEMNHELVYTGEIVDAAEALRIGMVGRVVPDDELESATAELAGRIAAQAPLA